MTIDKIKQRIQELVPDIMKLEFGCEVTDGIIFGNPRVDKVEVYYPEPVMVKEEDVRDLEILGRPIRLADVLRAIKVREAEENKKLDKSIEKRSGHPGVKYPLFYQAMMVITHNDLRDGEFWNLSDDNYDHQSQETKDFIGSLLK